MKILILICFCIGYTLTRGQNLILPYFINTHTRMNVNNMGYFTASAGDNGSQLFVQSDLYGNRYPNIKFAAAYFRLDANYPEISVSSLKLKANYCLPITRKISFIFSGSGGIVNTNTTGFCYSEGASYFSRKFVFTYHLFGQLKELVHSISFKAGPHIKIRKQEDQYLFYPYLSFSGNYTINDEFHFNPCSNYLQASLEMENFNIYIGIHEQDKALNPNLGCTFKMINYLDISTTCFLNRDQIPTVQVEILYRKQSNRHRRFINISTPYF